MLNSPALLRWSLLIDAVASGATALLLIAGAGLLEGHFGIPAALMRAAGLILVPYVAFVAHAGTRAEIARGAVWTVIACNVLWVLASAGLLVSGLIAPTLLGTAFVIAQAVAVGAFGELQYVALRRAPAMA